MSNSYLGYHFSVEPKDTSNREQAKQLGTEILIAELGEKPFESFIETDNGFSAYIQKDLWTEDILEDIYLLNSPEFSISFTIEEIDQVNWNEEWEKNFEPIDVDGKCHVRAPFHPKTEAQFDIVIEQNEFRNRSPRNYPHDDPAFIGNQYRRHENFRYGLRHCHLSHLSRNERCQTN
jgi:ribosomal protein L11 methyltransferase